MHTQTSIAILEGVFEVKFMEIKTYLGEFVLENHLLNVVKTCF